MDVGATANRPPPLRADSCRRRASPRGGAARLFIASPALAAALAAAAGGCSARNALTVRQDSAPPTQQHMKLASDWGYYAHDDNGRLSCLLAFPLPASRAGPRDFLLYLSLPAADGTHAFAPSDDAAGRGFFIQKKGGLRGITYLSSGTATVRDVWLQPGRKRIQFDLQCDDATRLAGSGTLEAAPSELDAFHARYVHDIERMAPTTQPAPSPANAGETRRGDP